VSVTGRRGRLAAELRSLGSATLGESGGRVLPPGIFPLDRSMACAGPALTVRCAPGDNLGVHSAIAAAEPGDVVVVVCDGHPDRGYLGEVLARAAIHRAVAGVVVDGGVRDTREIVTLGLPVACRTVALRGATKTGPAWLHAPITVASVAVADGDWVVADADGVVVVDAPAVDAVLAAAAERHRHEQQIFTDLAGGRTTLELLGIDTRNVHRSPRPSRAD